MSPSIKTPEQVEALLKEAYMYPRATIPEGLIPDLADLLKESMTELARLTVERDEAISELMASLEDKPGKRGYVHLLYCNNGHSDVMPGTCGVTCNCRPKLRALQVPAVPVQDALTTLVEQFIEAAETYRLHTHLAMYDDIMIEARMISTRESLRAALRREAGEQP